MNGMKDGFKRGTHMHYRTRMANMAAVQRAEIAASIARSTVVITPTTTCTRCGHPAAQHDLDRTALQPGQEAGGEGCLRDWAAESDGCTCPQFVVAR
jgi:hypothetical protein